MVADQEIPLSGNGKLRSPQMPVRCRRDMRWQDYETVKWGAEADPQFMHRTQDSIIVN